jgi:hypothetical protein
MRYPGEELQTERKGRSPNSKVTVEHSYGSSHQDFTLIIVLAAPAKLPCKLPF